MHPFDIKTVLLAKHAQHVVLVADPDRLQAMAILDAVRSLPGAYRETLILRLVEGMTGVEIADRTGLTPASVRVNLHRGMKLLRERMESRTVTNAKARALFHRAGHVV